VDKSRRKFLKIMLIGSGTIIAGRVLGPVLSRFLDDSPASKAGSLSSGVVKNFKINEDKKVLSVYDSSGEEILQIDKEA
jgi:hypothetical protein